MTYREIVDAVLRNLFDENERGNAQAWVNHRYGWLLALEQWSFLNQSGTLTLPAAAQLCTGAPADLGYGAILDVFTADGCRLTAIDDHRAFYANYLGADAGTPEAFTVVGSSILVGPASSSEQTATILYEADPAPMSDDDDEPVLPELFHFALVHGGRAEGMKLQHNPTWQSVEQDFFASVEAMRRKYLVRVRGAGTQYGAWRP